jgi:hypothetical protein
LCDGADPANRVDRSAFEPCRLLSELVAHGTRVFWLLIVLLLGASLYFGAEIETRRQPEGSVRAPQPPQAVTPESGH